MDTAVQTFEPTPEPSPRPSASAPQLRTLLLTDLVDSTGLVERLGDAPASDLFRAHDRLVLQLQQQWRGRLIDRSDGMLLLFERPIDGLGFALDYTRGLIALGDERGIELRARIGLHVGEVLTWRNSEEAVSVGAKPVEVEGLAKPMAARLMATARPGQILLSSVAEPLAHRAARELGERGLHLAWKAWGRWRFKGVPESQQIFEVGEPGIAPLRMPPDTPKAWRDIPLWRRPAALAAEIALLVGGALGVWFIARPEPAIAFNQRDWVVVGDLRNLTGQATLDDSLEQAFRISLEQSRHVNVLSDLKARDTLARMQRAPDTKLDRTIASEIALRDGARAVILPTVAEIGGRVRVSAEVIDPRTQTTVYTETAEGTGVASTLDSIDTVTASLRGKLGEAVKSIEKDSVPLPQVTTKNLDALRAYALGQKAYGENRYADAEAMYRKATELDPKFALAWLGQARSLYAAFDAPASLPALERAQQLRAQLPPREAMYLDGWGAELEDPGTALDKWQLMSRLYPDYGPSQANVAIQLLYRNRFAEAVPYAQRAIASKSAFLGNAYDQLGRAQLGLGNYRGAALSFDRAMRLGYKASLRRRADVAAAQREFDAAKALLAKADSTDPSPYLEIISVAVDTARWREAQAAVSKAQALVAERDDQYERSFRLIGATLAWLSGDAESALRQTKDVAERGLVARRTNVAPDMAEDIDLALSSALLAQRIGDRSVASRVLKETEALPMLQSLAPLGELRKVVEARQLLLSGKPRNAIAVLEPLTLGPHRYQTRVALMEAYAADGSWNNALEQARWLQQQRAVAYIEYGCYQCRQALNVADSNLAILHSATWLERLQKKEEARQAMAGFEKIWPAEMLPPYLRTLRPAKPTSN